MSEGNRVLTPPPKKAGAKGGVASGSVTPAQSAAPMPAGKTQQEIPAPATTKTVAPNAQGTQPIEAPSGADQSTVSNPARG